MLCQYFSCSFLTSWLFIINYYTILNLIIVHCMYRIAPAGCWSYDHQSCQRPADCCFTSSHTTTPADYYSTIHHPPLTPFMHVLYNQPDFTAYPGHSAAETGWNFQGMGSSRHHHHQDCQHQQVSAILTHSFDYSHVTSSFPVVTELAVHVRPSDRDPWFFTADMRADVASFPLPAEESRGYHGFHQFESTRLYSNAKQVQLEYDKDAMKKMCGLETTTKTQVGLNCFS